MNRPRNQQPRPPRDSNHESNQHTQVKSARHPPGSSSSHVPTTQQVIPGAAVSIVLKADQPTGREVQGLVQDLLTRGDHSRGIKVRLQDGRVGRVQRMAGRPTPAGVPRPLTDAPTAIVVSYQDDEYMSGPPPRSLADFIPDFERAANIAPPGPEPAACSTATATCPICGEFEGDEMAVSHHVEEHLR